MDLIHEDERFSRLTIGQQVYTVLQPPKDSEHMTESLVLNKTPMKNKERCKLQAY